jgi:hypothetical protein
MRIFTYLNYHNVLPDLNFLHTYINFSISSFIQAVKKRLSQDFDDITKSNVLKTLKSTLCSCHTSCSCALLYFGYFWPQGSCAQPGFPFTCFNICSCIKPVRYIEVIKIIEEENYYLYFQKSDSFSTNSSIIFEMCNSM